MSDLNCLPLFTKMDLVPSNLNFSFQEWHFLPLHEFNEKAEELRNYIINQVFASGHNFFSGNLTLHQIESIFNKFIKNDRTKLINPVFKSIKNRNLKYGSGIITYNNKITRAVNHWFPEIAYSKNSKGVSIVDQFYDKDIFYNNFWALLKKDRFKFVSDYPNAKLSKHLMQGLRLVNGNQPMQNFPIGIAKFIIENSLQYKLNNQEEFNIIDPCLGWGGRTVGALAISSTKRFENKIINFYGTDVHEAIYDRYGMLVEFWNNYICQLPNFHFFKPLEPTPYEDILQDKLFKDKAGTFDLALTSPPYFAIEQYSEDQNQSFKKFNTYNSWKEGFLKLLIFNTYILLKSGGEFYLNISDVKSNVSNSVLNELPLINDSIILAKQIGFRFDGKYFMEMPTHANFSKDISKNKKVRLRDEHRHKYEPILVFVK